MITSRITISTTINLAQTLECGQCFRHEKMADGRYKVVAFGKVLHVAQMDGAVEFAAPQQEVDAVWADYFDLNRDYAAVHDALAHDDTVMAKATAFSPGLRVLNQDPWETLISYIISQHNAIPNIKRVVRNLSERYGNPIRQANADVPSQEFAFPTPEQLVTAGLDGLSACKTGFRARYILGACRAVLSGEIPLVRETTTPTTELRAKLMQINGVGNKVADCVLLYGFGRFECFPVDVWIKRLMEEHYFAAETPLKDIARFADEKFGGLAGFANICLFNYRNSSSVIQP